MHLIKAFKHRPGTLYYITLTISFLTISIVTTMLVNVSLNERELLIKNYMNRTTMKILADMSLNRLNENSYKEDRIDGIAVYKSDGSTVFVDGNIKHDPRFSEESPYDSIYFDEKNRLILINNKFSEFQEKHPFPSEGFGYTTLDYNLTVHLESYDPVFFTSRTILKMVQIGLNIILFLIYCQMLSLFKRSNALKAELDSQKNLVILGTALRTLTHEMKNPLAAIRLQSGFIRRLHPEDLSSETIVIDKEVDRLARLMETVRDFLKDPFGKAEVFNTSVSLQELKELYPAEIQWKISDQPCFILFDRDKFRSVMENLINNAIESQSGLERIFINTSIIKKNLEITVKDQGRGISPESLEKIFDPFFTTKSTGSGMGLMIVKRFVDAAKGQLSIDSTEEEGTTVLIRLAVKEEILK